MALAVTDNLCRRCGPGALILPKEVSKISMEFNTKLYGGHRGARKFWREMLPRIKYRNPTIPISISRHTDADGPSLLHIYTTSPTPQQAPTTSSVSNQAPSSSATPNPQTTLVPDTSPPTHTLNIRDINESEILDMLVKTIGATQLEMTEQEKAEMQEMKEQNERSEKDRVQVREYLTKERREQELLKLARGEVPATN
ncbi:CI-B8 domain-containing protein [Paraphoma chrysanthemicola]|uniref:CI-B8 domain-containing protein n=1 Tax=Paraphoma chrysanthemicola TaxID=798071 RepID=A0A8K0RB39_9PLEO|nr:CI-B8 domain-containing protein [Paraphoma chrysanthemicola]